jgi:hypothetical protein
MAFGKKKWVKLFFGKVIQNQDGSQKSKLHHFGIRQYFRVLFLNSYFLTMT